MSAAFSPPPRNPPKKAAGYEIHEAALVWPALDPDDFRELVENIRAEGLREAVKLLGGKIVDGVHRALACEELGIKPKTENLSPATNPWNLTISANARRRHMTKSQITAYVLEIMVKSGEWAELRAKAKARQVAGRPADLPEPGSGTPTPEAALAKRAGVTTRTARDVAKVREKSAKKHREVTAGKKSAKQAAAEVREEKRAEEPKGEEPARAIVKKRSDALKAAVEEILAPLQRAHEGVQKAMKRLAGVDADLRVAHAPITLSEILGERLEIQQADRGTQLDPNLVYESETLKLLTQLLRGKLPHGECPNCSGEMVCPGEKCLQPVGGKKVCACGGAGLRCYLCKGLGFITKRQFAEVKQNPRFVP